MWFFSSFGGILELRRGSQASSWVGPGNPNLPLELRGKAGGCARVTAGPKRPHLGVCPGPNIPLQGRQGSRGCIPGSPGESGLVSRGSQDSALLSSRDAGLLALRRRGGQGPHLAKRWDPRGFSRVAAAFSSYDGDLRLPLGLAFGSPIFPSGCEGKQGVALGSLQGRRDLT